MLYQILAVSLATFVLGYFIGLRENLKTESNMLNTQLDYIDTNKEVLINNHIDELEAAACLWEEVLDLTEVDRNINDLTSSKSGRVILADQIEECFRTLGIANVRLIVIGWASRVNDDWEKVNGHDGQYKGSFDWEFIPRWIYENVDWSDPNNPSLKLVSLS